MDDLTITLDGNDYKLRFKGLALARFAEEFGETFDEALAGLHGNTVKAGMSKEEATTAMEGQANSGKLGLHKTVTLAAKVLWAAMLKHQPEIKYTDVLDMVGPDNIEYVMGKVGILTNPLGNSPKAG